jgi:hypothetical protein
MAGLQIPLSMLRLAPRDALRMTRASLVCYSFTVENFHLLLFAQSPGALAYNFWCSEPYKHGWLAAPNRNGKSSRALHLPALYRAILAKPRRARGF